MNLLSTILFGAYLSLMPIHGAGTNTTEDTTSAPDVSTTQIYTTLPDLTPGTTEADGEDCDFTYDVTLNDGEQIDITICGYEESDDDADSSTQYVGIQVDLPNDRWAAVGFVLADDFLEANPMKDAYAMIFPLQSRAFEERKMANQGQVGEELLSSLTLESDINDNGRRIISFKRKAKITIDDLPDEQESYAKYFDFEEFAPIACGGEIYLLWAHGALENEQFSASAYHGKTGAGYTKATVSAISGQSCVNDDSASGVHAICAVVVSIIAMLFN